ncbi:hypothetical protein HNS30_40220, partial [Corallococcus exercitus]|nr:hypothetical protein [Corallococcus exercitus]
AREPRAPSRIGRPARASREATPEPVKKGVRTDRAERPAARPAPVGTLTAPAAPEPEIPLGFRAKQKQRKQVKAESRAEKAEKQRLAAAKSAKKQKRK